MPPEPMPTVVDAAEFAAEFRRQGVTADRVAAALASVASRSVRIGPYGAGPLASVRAAGVLGTPRVTLADADAPAYRVTVPATLDLAVRVGVESLVRADVEIDLTLTPRPAHPLHLVIEVAPLGARDVRIQVRGRGLGAAVSGLIGVTPGAITDEVRRQVARQVSNLLDGDALRRGRTIDVGARIDGTPRAPSPRVKESPRWQWVDDAEFGRRFVARAVTRDRVAEGFAGLAERPLSIGPMKVGPGGMAEVRADGAIGSPVVVDEPGGYAITLPLGLDIVVDLARENRYRADLVVVLHAVPRPADGLRILIDIPPVTVDDMTVTLTAADNVAAMLARAGKLEEQLVAQVLRTVNDEVGRAGGRVVDIAARVAGH